MGWFFTCSMQDGANFDGTPAAPITDPLQMVLSEYRHELTGEFSLFYDLRRAGAQDAADFINTTYGTQTNLLPIPNPAPGPTHDGQVHGLYNAALTLSHEILPIPTKCDRPQSKLIPKSGILIVGNYKGVSLLGDPFFFSEIYLTTFTEPLIS